MSNTLQVISGKVLRVSDQTNSVKALKEDMVLMIRLQSHQVHPTALTILQLCSVKQKHTKYKHKHNESMHSEMGRVRQNPIQRTVRTVHLSVLMTVQRTSMHNTTQNSSDNLLSYLQTNIIAQMLSVGGEGVERRTDRQTDKYNILGGGNYK